MKRLLILAGALFWIISLKAQTFSPEVVATAGQSFSSPDAQTEFTVGEVVTSSLTVTGGTHTLTQGFHQPVIQFTAIEKPDQKIFFSLYPNPTEQFVTVETSDESEMQVHVYDAMGKDIELSPLFKRSITLDLGPLSSGSYIMVITNTSGNPLSSYTVIKN